MATLSVDKPRTFELGHDELLNDLPMVATDIIYEGAAVGELNDTGTYQPLNLGATTLDKFAGFAGLQADNSAGAASAVNVKVRQRGRIRLSVTGVSATTDIDKMVYATDDDTFTLTYAATAVSIGKIVRWETGTFCIVDFEAFYLRKPITASWSMGNGTGSYAIVDTTFFVANQPYYVKSASEVHAVAAGGTSDVQLVKDTTTDAPGAGTNLLTNHGNAGFDLSATANTVQEAAFSATAGVKKLLKGDRLSLDFANAIQSTTTLTVTVELVRL